MPDPITLRVQPSARLRMQAHSDRFTTTPDELPEGERTFYAIPRAGDGVEDPETGRHYTVERVVWWTNGEKPWLTLD